MEKLEYKHFKFDVVNDDMTLMEYTGEEENVVIPDEIQGQAVTVIGDGSFTFSSDSSKILEVVLPKYLEVIGSFAFSSCPSLKTIKIPEHFKEFHRNAFFQCTSLEEIHFPKSVEKIPETTFLMCDSLKRVTCDNEKTKISPRAFGYKNNLEDVSFSILKKLQLIDQVRISGNLLNKFSTFSEEEQEEMKDFVKKKADLRNSLFLQGNLSVVTFLLELSEKLTLEQVDEYLESSIAREDSAVTAFFLDYKNKKFTKEVQDAYHKNKEFVEMGLELPTLEQFQKKWKCNMVEGGICVTQYIGKDTYEVIPEALADGTKIVALNYDLKETAGGIQHFVEAKLDFGSIIHLDIKASIKTLNNMSRNASLETIILPDSIEEVERKSIFSHCKNLRTVNLPKKLTTLPIRMFMGCSSLEEIEIPEHVTMIGSHIFQDCSALKEIRLPEGITEIPSHAFSQCSSLTSVILPRKLDLIDSSAFSGCPSLKNLSMTEPPENVSDCAFHDCTGLVDEQGLIILQNVLYSYLGTAEKVVIPEGTKVVAKDCFSNSNIKEVVFPSSFRNEEIQKELMLQGIDFSSL